MSLSKQTLENLLEAESHIRAAIRVAASCEKPMIVNQLSKILMDMEHCKKFEEIMDMLENRNPGSSGSFGPMFGE
jgi:hypothetical protein